MPKQISHKLTNNSSFKQNQEKNRDRDLLYPDKQKRDLSEGNNTYYHNISTSNNQNVNIVKSSSKKNINMQNNNNPLSIQDNSKNKKVEIIQGGSYISTPVFNKDKDKSNEKDRSRYLALLIF